MIVFCDVDGVLNFHQAHPNGYCGTYPECVKQFNRILDEFPDLKLVISSAWRYLVYSGSMNITGLENLFLSHGLNCRHKILDVTRKDLDENDSRENQIMEYVDRYKLNKWIVIDDLDLKIDNFFRTNGEVGLTKQDADAIICILQTSKMAQILRERFFKCS